MKLAQIALILALLPAALAADEKPVATPAETIKFIELKYLGTDRSDRLDRVVNVINQLTGGKVSVVRDSVLKTLALRGSPEAVANAEQLLRRFDTPAAENRVHQILLTLYLVEATDQASGTQKPPAELTSALEQLRTAFGYKGFRILDTIPLQGKEGSEFSLTGLIPMETSTPGAKTTFTAKYQTISYNESLKTVNVYGFRFEMRIPFTAAVGSSQFSWAESSIRTDLAIKDGQKLILGKMTKDQTEKGVFVVVTAKVD